MQLFHGFHHEEKLKCPYKGCEKTLDGLPVITGATVALCQTHYACPYCMSKVTLITEKNKVIEVKPNEYPTVFDSPMKMRALQQLTARARRKLPLTGRMPQPPESAAMQHTQKISQVCRFKIEC